MRNVRTYSSMTQEELEAIGDPKVRKTMEAICDLENKAFERGLDEGAIRSSKKIIEENVSPEDIPSEFRTQIRNLIINGDFGQEFNEAYINGFREYYFPKILEITGERYKNETRGTKLYGMAEMSFIYGITALLQEVLTVIETGDETGESEALH